MYRSHLEVQRPRPSRQIRMLTGLVVLCLGQGCLQVAGAAESTAVMKYAAASGFAAGDDQRFQLIAGEIELGDDCNPLPLAASSLSTEPIVLAKADDEKKSHRKKRTKEEAPATMIDAAPMASAPLAAPAAIGLSAAGTREWEIIVSDKTLNATMARWAAAAGWQLLWELPVDYAVEARTQVRGTFEEAVSIVAGSMESAEIPMKAVFYQGNKVLRIMAKGSE